MEVKTESVEKKRGNRSRGLSDLGSRRKGKVLEKIKLENREKTQRNEKKKKKNWGCH